MRNFLKKYGNYVLSFIIPFALLFLIFTFVGVGFHLKKNVLVGDMRAQYYPLINYLKDTISMPSLFLYSFSSGLGSGMFGTIAYYCLSPIFIITILFKKVDLVDFAYLLILIKIALCGFTMYVYLSKHNKKQDKIYLLFSTIYALSGFLINYNYNIMWLNGVYILPLLALFIERIVEKKSSVPYILILVYGIVTNYYIGYMLCIFSAIYFLYCVAITYNFKIYKKLVMKIFIKFAISSLIACLLSIIVLIPTYIDLSEGFKIEGANIKSVINSPSHPLEVLGRLLIGSANQDTITSYHLPNIYSSLLVLPLVLFYLIKSKGKEKYLFVGLLVFMILPFFIPFFNYIWHGFNFPNWLNYRFSFIISFLLVSYAYKGFTRIDKTKIHDYIIFYLLFLILSIILGIKSYEWLPIKMIIISNAFMITYLLFLFFGRNIKLKFYFNVLIGLFAIIELLLNGYLVLKTYSYYNNEQYYWYYNNHYELFKDYLPKDNEFYRIDKNYCILQDENFVFGNYGINMFLSTYKIRPFKFLEKSGYRVDGNNSTYYKAGNTAITDSILGFKYLFVLGQLDINEISNLYKNRIDKDYLEALDNQDEIGIFKNDNALNLGYMVSNKIKEDCSDSQIESLEYQKEIFSKMIGEDSNTLIKLERIENKDNYARFNLPNDNKIYYLLLKSNIHFEHKNTNESIIDFRYEGYIYINDDLITNYNDNVSNIIIIPEKYKGEDIEIRFEQKTGSVKVEEFNVYSFDNDIFEKEISLLKDNQLEIEVFDNTYIKGKVYVTDNKVFFSSIPNEKGWKVYVDGKRIEHYDLLDCFIGFDLEEGEHTVEFKYSVPGLIPGVILSFLGLAGLICVIIYEKKQKVRNI